MQVVYRAKSIANAQTARDVLVASGIASHIADEALWERGELAANEGIRVMVDNRAVDRARRTLEAWKRESAESKG